MADSRDLIATPHSAADGATDEEHPAVPQGTDWEMRERYLDLVAHAVMGTIREEAFQPIRPAGGRGGRLRSIVIEYFNRWGIVPHRLLDAQQIRQRRLDLEAGRVRPQHGLTMIGRARLNNIRTCVESVLREGVPGDFLEAGVWRGGASIFARALLVAHRAAERRVWVADSFRGLPPPDPGYPADAGDTHHKVTDLAVDMVTVRNHFALFGLLDEGVRFLPGWFAETLPSAPLERLAVLRIDGDMYESTMTALNALYDRVSPGGYVIIDDYGALPACRLAVEDFRSRRGLSDPLVWIDWTGVFWRKK